MSGINKLKHGVAAIGLGLAMVGGPAVAGVTWTFPFTVFQDDDIDFILRDSGVQGQIDVGDQLFAVIEITTSSGQTILPDELTGVAAIEVVAIADLDGVGGLNDLIFAPINGGVGLSSLAATYPVLATLPAGSMLALYLDSSPDLAIDAGLPANQISCTTRDQCVAQATDGEFFQADGFTFTDLDEHWFSLNSAFLPYALVAGSLPGETLATFNFGLTTLDTGAGHVPTDESVPCGTQATLAGLCNGNGLVWLGGQGNVNGAALLPAGLLADGAFATSDFDALKQPVPAPGTLALFALGLLGLGASLRRTWRVSN